MTGSPVDRCFLCFWCFLVTDSPADLRFLCFLCFLVTESPADQRFSCIWCSAEAAKPNQLSRLVVSVFLVFSRSIPADRNRTSSLGLSGHPVQSRAQNLLFNNMGPGPPCRPGQPGPGPGGLIATSTTEVASGCLIINSGGQLQRTSLQLWTPWRCMARLMVPSYDIFKWT